MKTRDYRLDILRVISMVMVIIIHIANYYCRAFYDIDNLSYIGSLVFNTIARVSVPFFFMISGATLLNKDYDKNKNKSRIINKIITLIGITIIYFLWDTYFMGKTISFVSILSKPSRKMLWFIYAIISIYIALPFIKCMVDKMGKDEDKLFVILWLLFNGVLKHFNIGTTYLIPIITGTYYLGYFIIGYLIVKYYAHINKNKNNKLLLAITILSWIIVITTTYFVSMSNNKHFTSLLTYSNLLIMLPSLSSFIYLYFNMKNKEYKIISIASNLSFGVYLFHGVVLDYIMKLLPYRNINSFIGVPIILIIVTVLTSIVVGILKKTFISKYI